MSHRQLRTRLPVLVAGSLAGLALAASPALAGSDGDAPPPLTQPPAPAPPPPAPLPQTVTEQSGGGGVEAENVAKPEKAKHESRTRPTRVLAAHQSRQVVRGATVIPRGAVAAGAGGTAPHGPDGLLALLAGGLVLTAAGGGLVAAGRRASS
jgi:hypothetical protein